MASNPYNTSIFSDVLKLNPTFFSLFIGNNDVLAHILSGATTNSITPLEGPSGVGFNESINEIIESLMSNGAKGAIANLADLDSAPYFNAIPYDGLFLNKVDELHLNQIYELHGLSFIEGKNAFVINCSVGNPNEIRQIQKGEFILLDIMFDENKEEYLRGKKPIPKKYVVTNSEKLNAQNFIVSYNEHIKAIADKKNIALVDINRLLKITQIDRVYNSSSLDFKYKNGGVFSLDGLHPNAYGQALLANEFIKAVNFSYDTKIPLLNSNAYKKSLFA
jgi:hypothetical protein